MNAHGEAIAAERHRDEAMLISALIFRSVCGQRGPDLRNHKNLPLGPLPSMRPGQVKEEIQ
jgi:hypothetical protein